MEEDGICEKVKSLIKRPQPVQRTKEWFDARRTRITASAVSSLLVKNKEFCEEYVKTYGLQEEFDYNNKCCNPYSSKKQFAMDKVKQTFKGSEATFWGQRYEPIATMLYELKKNKEVLEFGLIAHDSIDWLAASPDGITKDGIMLEIKCPFRRKITGIPPIYYYQQCQIQLEVCDLDVCDFFEIEFIEVVSFKEFLDDSLQESDVEFKGLYLQIENIPDEYESREYVYPPRELINNVTKLVAWKNDMLEELIETRNFSSVKSSKNNILCRNNSYKTFNIRTTYWKTVVTSIVPITRDQKWFNSVKPYLEKEWGIVKDFVNNYQETNIIDLKSEKVTCLF